MAEPKNILIVDDEADIVTYLSALLSDAGYAVRVARNGQEGLTEVRRERPDLVSLDITMPEKSGVGFFREMRSDPDLATVPIVIVTGVANPWAGRDGSGDIHQFLSTRKNLAPPDAFFEKPVVPEEYIGKIAELTGA